MFKEINEESNLNLRFNETKRIVIFPNGSRTRLAGVDASEKEMRKLLGQKLRKVTIDEAGSISNNMEKICYQMIMPALADLRPNSWLSIIGTPENIPNTFFEKVDTGKEKGVPWVRYNWTAYDNPFMRTQWEAEIEELQKSNANIFDASWFKTHYLGQWCVNDNLLILDISKAQYGKLKFTDRTICILGVDLGYNDACSFNIVAYNMDENCCYLIKSYKKAGLDITATINEVNYLREKFPIVHFVVDGANKQGVQEMVNRHNIPFETAEKMGKAMYLRLLRDDIITGKIKLSDNPKEIEDFKTEAELLVWKDEQREFEDPRCQNHCTDGVLYAWRYAYSYLYQKPTPAPKKGSEEYQELMFEKEAQEELEKLKEQYELEEDMYGS